MDNQEFQNIVLEKLSGIDKRLDNIENEVKSVKHDVNTLKQDFNTLKQDVNTLKQDVNTLKQDVNMLKQDVTILKSQTDENTKMLKSLIHASEVHKADVDRLDINLAKTQGEVVALRKDFTTVERMTVKNYSDILDLKALSA